MTDFKIEITASVVAWYAAVVATTSAFFSGLNIWRDRPRIKISLNKNMQIHPASIKEDDKTFIAVNVANKGRRTTTITHVGFYEIGKKETGLLADSFIKGPRELQEGKSTMYLMDQSLIDIEKLKTVIAIDATGKTYKKKISRKFRRN